MAILGSELRTRIGAPPPPGATEEELALNRSLARPTGATLRQPQPSAPTPVLPPPMPPPVGTGPSTVTPPAPTIAAPAPNIAAPASGGTPVSSVTPPMREALSQAKAGQANVVQGAEATGQLPSIGNALRQTGLPGGVMLPPPMPGQPPVLFDQPSGPGTVIPQPRGQPSLDDVGGPVTPFGPGDDLRFSQFNPEASERLGTTQGLVNTAARGVADQPNLRQAASERLRLFEEEAEPGWQRALQDVGRRAAAFGRVGAGMTTNELGDLGVVRERALAGERRRQASDLAFAEGGEARARLAALGGLESDQFGQEAAMRDELRGERGYQYGVGRDAIEDRVRRAMLEESLTQGQFGRDATRATLGLDAAGQYDRQAESSEAALADLLGEFGARSERRRRRPGTTGIDGEEDRDPYEYA